METLVINAEPITIPVINLQDENEKLCVYIMQLENVLVELYKEAID